MPLPTVKMGSALAGTEKFFGIQGGGWRQFTSAMFSTMILSSHDFEDQVNALVDTRGTTWAKVAGKPTVFPSDWSSVANKPTTYPTNIAGVSGLQTALDAKQPALKFLTFAGTTNASGVATITFTGLTTINEVDPIIAWAAGPQMITGTVTASSPTGCTVQVMRSRATLLLSTGPFEAAPAGVSISVRVVGT